ncbi:hypothetical protein K474DRAFT_1713699 [Panus rudis PR-1116 ss-1]|nr:hypothetical protein K474DRAFT_1713699 [Panus rudis PR-1116 ss-1]
MRLFSIPALLALSLSLSSFAGAYPMSGAEPRMNSLELVTRDSDRLHSLSRRNPDDAMDVDPSPMRMDVAGKRVQPFTQKRPTPYSRPEEIRDRKEQLSQGSGRSLRGVGTTAQAPESSNSQLRGSQYAPGTTAPPAAVYHGASSQSPYGSMAPPQAQYNSAPPRQGPYNGAPPRQNPYNGAPTHQNPYGGRLPPTAYAPPPAQNNYMAPSNGMRGSTESEPMASLTQRMSSLQISGDASNQASTHQTSSSRARSATYAPSVQHNLIGNPSNAGSTRNTLSGSRWGRQT